MQLGAAPGLASRPLPVYDQSAGAPAAIAAELDHLCSLGTNRLSIPPPPRYPDTLCFSGRSTPIPRLPVPKTFPLDNHGPN